MAVRLVAYDLKVRNKDNKELIDALEGYQSFHLQESVWLVDTQLTSKQLRAELVHVMKAGDMLFISRVTPAIATAGLTQVAKNWLASPSRTWKA